MPPPLPLVAATLWSISDDVTARVPVLATPPPSAAWPSVTRVFRSSSEPALRMLPPSSLPARPPVIVTPLMLTVTPATTLITRVDPLPWMIVSRALPPKRLRVLAIASSPWESVYVPLGSATVSLVPAAATAPRSVVHAK